MIGFRAYDLSPVASAAFLEANPAAATFIEQVRIPIEDIYAQNRKMFEGEDADEDIARHVAEWIAANRDQFKEWLAKARQAAE